MPKSRVTITPEYGPVADRCLAHILGVTPRRVRQLREQGVVSTDDHDHFLFPEAVQEYMAWLKKRRGGADVAELRAEDLRVKIAERKQKMDMARADFVQEIRDEAFEVVADALGEYRSMLQCLAVDPSTQDKLNNLLTEAIHKISAEKSE